jgi:hypothetical protein
MRAERGFVRAFVLLIIACPVFAQEIPLTPVADAFVASAQPTSNFGGAGALSLAGPGLAKGEFQTVLRFDAAVAKAAFDASFGAGAWSIEGVTLKLTASAAPNPIFNPLAAGGFSASWMEDDSWVEGDGTPGMPAPAGVTFATLPTFLGPSDAPLGAFFFSGITTGAHTYTLFAAPSLVDDIEAGGLVSIRLAAADASVSYVFNSRNFPTPANWPVLTIGAVRTTSSPGDLDHDGDVDQQDLGVLLAAYGTCAGQPGFNPDADIDDSGCVNQHDLGLLLADWDG